MRRHNAGYKDDRYSDVKNEINRAQIDAIRQLLAAYSRPEGSHPEAPYNKLASDHGQIIAHMQIGPCVD